MRQKGPPASVADYVPRLILSPAAGAGAVDATRCEWTWQECAQRLQHLLDPLVAILAPLGQCATDDRHQRLSLRLSNVEQEVRDRRRFAGQDRGELIAAGLTREWSSIGQHLVKDDTQTEDVRPLINPQATRLLWRHVGDGAENQAGFCLE